MINKIFTRSTLDKKSEIVTVLSYDEGNPLYDGESQKRCQYGGIPHMMPGSSAIVLNLNEGTHPVFVRVIHHE